MDNFTVIYKILSALEQSMDHDGLDERVISADKLGISENRRIAILKMLADSGYVEGVHIRVSVDGIIAVGMNRPRITLRGLEYLEENSLMKRAYKMLKGVKDILPI